MWAWWEREGSRRTWLWKQEQEHWSGELASASWGRERSSPVGVCEGKRQELAGRGIAWISSSSRFFSNKMGQGQGPYRKINTHVANLGALAWMKTAGPKVSSVPHPAFSSQSPAQRTQTHWEPLLPYSRTLLQAAVCLVTAHPVCLPRRQRQVSQEDLVQAPVHYLHEASLETTVFTILWGTINFSSVNLTSMCGALQKQKLTPCPVSRMTKHSHATVRKKRKKQTDRVVLTGSGSQNNKPWILPRNLDPLTEHFNPWVLQCWDLRMCCK